MDDDAQNAILEQQDADEWDQAINDFSAEKGLKPEGGEDDAAKKAEDEKAAADKAAAEAARGGDGGEGGDDDKETPEEKEAREAAEAAKAQSDRERAQAVRDARTTQRDLVTETNELRNDIVTNMFPDADGKLYDADNDEIKGIEDVMQLVNPNTGKNFTEEEAATWFLKASQQAKQEQIDAYTKATQYTEVNLSIKDASDVIKEKYADWLADPANAELRDEILADYLSTLVLDPKTDIVIDAPIDMVRFYDRALKPYVDAQSKVADAEAAQKAAEEAAQKAEQEKERVQTRGDRADIFAKGDNPRNEVTKDEEEWDEAFDAHYGKSKKK